MSKDKKKTKSTFMILGVIFAVIVVIMLLCLLFNGGANDVKDALLPVVATAGCYR